ncbi:MAG: leucine--tRNA ligase [Candidatus Sericytochromatia bacterium]|nr:MAG: leucine--tRNA ligase [Candidatus Sericytochromatia bacterium]
MRYNHREIDSKWQKFWEENKIFKTDNYSNKPKYYVLDMFPYPSGKGLHVGHPKGYVASDIIARYKRMKGFEVLHPMGWDAFGLPTERQATKEKKHPSVITERNINTFRNQLKLIGLSYDWDREISTTDPNYYKWTQWIFLKLYEKGLAYQAEIPVNWCPALGTVLANEEVKDGVYIETGDPVEKKLMKQWMLKITAYADRLIKDLDLIDWPENIKEMQRNWIGRSEGTIIKFKVEDTNEIIEVFSTRADTLFGGTYLVLAPEHNLVKKIAKNKKEVEEYINQVSKLSERDRISKEDKTGVWTGAYAINPVNNKRIPIWISDYVLASYGKGAVFACPAHDERDYYFAKKFNLEIIEVVKGGDISKGAYTGDGIHINSDFLNGLNIKDAKIKINDWLEKNNLGYSEINYKLRDWLFSRQRYWGEPIPILFSKDNNEIKPVPYEELPVLLPYLEDFSTSKDGYSPLTKAQEWLIYKDKETGKEYIRETNTMPQWAGSCWYYLRFIDPNNDKELCNKELEKRFMPVDLYIGGTEHATLHLLYARFWHKVLYDLGVVSTPEPFYKLFNQGMILARSYKDEQGKYYYPSEVKQVGDEYYLKDSNKKLITQIEKMSKSKYNVVTPDEIIEEFGADSLRLYEMFMGDLQDTAVWQTENILGIRRFLDKVWRFYNGESRGDLNYEENRKSFEVLLHKSIKKVTEDIEKLSMNTAISQMMILINEMTKYKELPNDVLSIFIRLLAPFAPHISEEIWFNLLGNKESIAYATFPEFDLSKISEDTINIPVQVNGKLRDNIDIPNNCDEETAKNLALSSEKLKAHLENKNILKIVYVKNKILNIVVN